MGQGKEVKRAIFQGRGNQKVQREETALCSPLQVHVYS